MFRCTAVARKMSPFALFVKENRKGKVSMTTLSQRYKRLNPSAKSALVKRAKSQSNPKAAQWTRFVKAHANQYTSLSPSARMKKIGQLYRKQASKAKATKAKKVAVKKPAARKVKKAAKAAKGKKAAKH